MSKKSDARQNLLPGSDAAFSCEFFFVSKGQFAEYEEAYPGVPIEIELLKMAQWLKANSEKKNYPRFIANWLSAAHSKLLEVQMSTEIREGIRTEERRAAARVGLWKGYKRG